jgi:hypothetical protein
MTVSTGGGILGYGFIATDAKTIVGHFSITILHIFG